MICKLLAGLTRRWRRVGLASIATITRVGGIVHLGQWGLLGGAVHNWRRIRWLGFGGRRRSRVLLPAARKQLAKAHKMHESLRKWMSVNQLASLR